MSQISRMVGLKAPLMLEEFSFPFLFMLHMQVRQYFMIVAIQSETSIP